MTPERKEQIKEYLRHAGFWDKAKLELHKMLAETIKYIEELQLEIAEHVRAGYL